MKMEMEAEAGSTAKGIPVLEMEAEVGSTA